MSAKHWNGYSVELDRISKTLNGADIDARTADINKTSYGMKNPTEDLKQFLPTEI
jgi:hypothetical protein